ncbi:MAG TPA: hypothetical protein VHQ86_04055, partial [Candidatus Saccharimonadia bacterium]|nr:hypothetical protein [Candidatus Saccharimonadia bacterium]
MNRKAILAVLVVLIVGGAIVAFAMSHNTNAPSSSPSPSASPTPTSQANEPSASAAPVVAASSFVINADDSSADQENLSV